MSRLKALFNQGFMRLTGGKKIIVLTQDEVVETRDTWEKLCCSYREHQRLEKEIEALKQMRIQAYMNGIEQGLKRGSNRTLLLPVSIKEEKKHLVGIVGEIATELLEQGDSESCVWLLKKTHQCRSL